jgi:hypothetical protein
MREISSPTQTFDGRPLPLASEFESSALMVPLMSLIETYARTDLYGDLRLEVVTLLRRKWRSKTARATYMLWAHDDTPCKIENLCSKCEGKGCHLGMWNHDIWFDCLNCLGRGWFYV